MSAAVVGRAVLLDLDDTLVDTRHAFRVAIGEVVATYLPHLDDARTEEALAHWLRDAGGHFRAYTRGEIGFSEQRHRRAAALHEHFGGPPLDGEGFLAWEVTYDAAFRGAWTLFPESGVLLDWLDEAGLRYGIVTNASTDYQRAKLEAVGLAGRVEILVGTDRFGVGKPDPRVFHLACDLLGVAPGEAAYVGDELDVDARGARDAGLLGIWLDRHGRADAPQDVPWVASLGEVPAVLAAAPGWLGPAPSSRSGSRSGNGFGPEGPDR